MPDAFVEPAIATLAIFLGGWDASKDVAVKELSNQYAGSLEVWGRTVSRGDGGLPCSKRGIRHGPRICNSQYHGKANTWSEIRGGRCFIICGPQ